MGINYPLIKRIYSESSRFNKKWTSLSLAIGFDIILTDD